MRPFQSAYIGRHEFPKGLGEFELRQWFTFGARDGRSVRRTFRSKHSIGAALQAGFVAMTGGTRVLKTCERCLQSGWGTIGISLGGLREILLHPFSIAGIAKPAGREDKFKRSIGAILEILRVRHCGSTDCV